MARVMVHILHVGLIAAAPGIACAQSYPSKPIRIVTNAAGGGNDFMARVIAQGIAGPLGQPVIIDNRPTGVIQAEVVYKAPPDGYTVLVQGASLWIVTLLQKMPYDVWKDLSPVAQIARDVNIVAAHPSLPAKSIKELIALAKARPAMLNYGSGNPGSPSHLASELFKSMAGINIVAVPYKSTPQAMMALIGGEVQLTIVDAGLTAPHVKSGRLRALAVTSARPSTLAPGLPTVAEAGLPGYEAVNMVGMFAPAQTPASVITRLNQEIVQVLNKPDVRQKVFEYGTEATGSTPEEFAAAIKSDMARLGKVIRDAGIKLD